MGLSSPGVGIHGTNNDASIGYSVSHGCIRMHVQRRRVAVQPRRDRHAGLHSLGLTASSTCGIGAQALSVALVAGLLALLVWKVAHQVGDATIASDVHKGKEPATPAFDLPRLDGGTLASASLHGKPQVVNFWASWCIPCRDEARLLQDASKQYDGRLVVLGIDHQDFRGDARGFVRRYGLTYPSVVDKGDKLTRSTGSPACPRRSAPTARARRRTRAGRRHEGDTAAVHPGRALLVAVAALLLCAAPALASEAHPTQGELEGEVICPTCHTTLDQSSSPIALRMKAFIARRIAAGDTRSRSRTS